MNTSEFYRRRYCSISTPNVINKSQETNIAGILRTDECLNNLKYADDTVIIADILLETMTRVLKICNWMSREDLITFNGQRIKRVNSNAILEIIRNDQWYHSHEIREFVETTNQTFQFYQICRLKSNIYIKTQSLK